MDLSRREQASYPIIKLSSNDRVPLICKLYTKRQITFLLPIAEFVPADASVAAFEGTILATEGGAQTRVLIAAILLKMRRGGRNRTQERMSKRKRALVRYTSNRISYSSFALCPIRTDFLIDFQTFRLSPTFCQNFRHSGLSVLIPLQTF